MNVELKPIAESKVRQLGGDVCGVLVRKDDKLAAVDEHGRVQWLQSGQGAEVVAVEYQHEDTGQIGYVDLQQVERGFFKNNPRLIEIARYYDTRPQPPQQGSVPEGHVAIPKDVAAAKGMYLVGYSWLKHNAPDELTTPQPEGDGWIKCGERLPTKADQYVWLCFEDYGVSDLIWKWNDEIGKHGETHWKPTGLKRPQPPEEGSSDE